MSILLLVGLATAWACSHFFERILRVVGLDRLCDRLGIVAALLRGGIKTDPSHLVGRTVYWLIVIFASMASLGALNVAPINQAAHSLLAYIPHLVTAAVIGTVGYLVSNFVSQAVLIAAVNAGLPPARWIAAGTRWGIQLLTVAMVLEQLGIAQHIVVVGFGITWGGLVLAAALALGLGGKDLAKDFLERRLAGRTQMHAQRTCDICNRMSRYILFTDLDGCLLDSDTYSFEEARPALDALRAIHMPVILVSSKTRAEMEPLRQRLDHHDPFVVENGAAVFVPLDTFDFPMERSRRRSAYHVIELGTPYALLRDVLKQIEEAVGTPLPGFGDLSLDEIMRATGLSRDSALRAKLREYDEPFLLEGPPALIEEVCRQIVMRGLQWTKGGRFFHLTGANDKGRSADILRRCYRRQWQIEGVEGDCETVGIGDSSNDLPLLLTVDRPVLVQKPDGSYDPDIDLPGLIRAPGIGPVGWNRAVLELLNQAA